MSCFAVLHPFRVKSLFDFWFKKVKRFSTPLMLSHILFFLFASEKYTIFCYPKFWNDKTLWFFVVNIKIAIIILIIINIVIITTIFYLSIIMCYYQFKLSLTQIGKLYYSHHICNLSLISGIIIALLC